jgi:hypothetical protein
VIARNNGPDDSAIRVATVDTGGGQAFDNLDEEDGGFDTGEDFALVPSVDTGTGGTPSGNDQIGQFTYTSANGAVVTAQFQADDAGAVGADDCLFSGTAVGG